MGNSLLSLFDCVYDHPEPLPVTGTTINSSAEGRPHLRLRRLITPPSLSLEMQVRPVTWPSRGPPEAAWPAVACVPPPFPLYQEAQSGRPDDFSAEQRRTKGLAMFLSDVEAKAFCRKASSS